MGCSPVQPVSRPDARHWRPPALELRAPIVAEVVSGALVVIGTPFSFVRLLTAESHLAIGIWSAVLSLLAMQSCLLFHDTLHGASFRDDRANVVLGRVIGAFYFWPFHFLRSQHLQHHRRVGLIDGDTELLHYTPSVARERRFGRALAWLARTPMAPLLYTLLMQASNLVDWLKSLATATRQQKRAAFIDFAAMALLWGLVNAWPAAAGKFWRGFGLGLLVPEFVAMAAIYLASKPLHSGMAAYSLKGYSHPHRVFLTSRSFESSVLVRLLMANLNFHIEHHLYPRLSRWKLAEASRQARSSLLAHARELGCPLQVHPSYMRFGARYRRFAKAYNGNTSFDRFMRFNDRLTGGGHHAS